MHFNGMETLYNVDRIVRENVHDYFGVHKVFHP